MRVLRDSRGLLVADTQGFTLGWYVVPLGGTGNATLVLPTPPEMGNQLPFQRLALRWYAAAPFAQKTAPTGRCISAQGATLGMWIAKGMRSEGTPHRDCTGTHSPSDDMWRSFRTRGLLVADTQGFTLGWYVVPLGAQGMPRSCFQRFWEWETNNLPSTLPFTGLPA